MSDHNYITFTLDTGRTDEGRSTPNKNTGTNNKGGNNTSVRWKMDQEIYDQVLEWKCSMYNNRERMEEGSEEKDAEWIQQTMIEAADAAMQRVRRGSNHSKRQVYWWCDDIVKARSRCIQDRRTRAKTKKKKKERIQRGNEVDLDNLRRLERNYKNSRKKVVKAIYKAKEEAWKELIKEIDKDQWGIPYKVIMNKLRTTGPGLTETLEGDKLEKLIFKLFPRETEEVQEEEVNVGA